MSEPRMKAPILDAARDAVANLRARLLAKARSLTDRAAICGGEL